MSERSTLEGITREAWEACWRESGRAGLIRFEAATIERRLRVAERLDTVLREEERHGELPWPYARLSRAIRRWVEQDRLLNSQNADAYARELHKRGRPMERTTRFLRLMFECDPSLPTAPGSWLCASDSFGNNPEPEGVANPEPNEDPVQHRARRREFWKTALKPFRRPSTDKRSGTKSGARASFPPVRTR